MKAEHKRERACLGLLAVLAVFCAMPAFADVKGEIITTENRRLKGMIRWMQMSKVYSVTGDNDVVMKIPLKQVADVKVTKPDGLDEAIALVQNGKYSKGAKKLEEIAEEYRMLQWDMTATRWLVYAYLKDKKAAEAITACDKIVRLKPEAAFTGDLASMYWEALLDADREATLKKILEQAVQRGDRELAAKAQVKRGDIDRKHGNFKDALVDGYLRTIVLFEQVKSVQAEALYKALKCFEELGQMSYAEKMRGRLLNDYADSPYAKMIQAGR